jgi:Ca2+-binding RTX toxin-like protein
LSALDGSNGFTINGIDSEDFSGGSVSNAGDVNGDGFDDIIIGASGADPNGIIDAGETYVVFGSNTGFPSSLDLSALDGSNGFTINGVDSEEGSLIRVSDAGDVNGDGFDDVIIGASEVDINGGNSVAESYVVFGFSGNISEDTLSGGESDEQISDESGNSSIIGTELTDNLSGDSSNNTILGLEGDDQLSGNEGDDTIDGNQGLDIIRGGDGNDVLFGGQDSDIINGDLALFNTDFSNNNDLIFGNLGGDGIAGDEGNDTIYGGKDDDNITGGLGNDLIFGDLGNDTIRGIGSPGLVLDPGTPQIDTLTGGPGADSFILGSGFFTTDYTDHGNNDYALITDFNQSESDLIDFDFSIDFPAVNNVVLDNMTLPDIGMGTGVFVTISGENEFVAFIQGIDANNLNLIEPVSGLVTIQ